MRRVYHLHLAPFRRGDENGALLTMSRFGKMNLAGELLTGCALVIAVSVYADDKRSELPLIPERKIQFETSEATWLSLDVAPDGATLVFEMLGDLYKLPITGGVAVPLTRGIAFDSQPRYSPDGQKIVFVSDRDGGENLWTIAAAGGEPQALTRADADVEFASPHWSPDGSHVVVSQTDWNLRTFELWAYHIAGGEGIQLTKAKANSTTAVSQRQNALGAVYSPDARYLYYARKRGGFAYNLRFPQWQIVRKDLRSGEEDYLTQAQGSAFRPVVSADGRWLVYATRYAQQTGLRLRDLNGGQDRWLVYPVEHDEQESRFTRDLLPGYAFAPDSASVIYAQDGHIKRVFLADGVISEIPFTAAVDQDLGPRLYFPYRLGVGPVKARLLMGPVPSPDDTRVAYSAFTRLYVFDRESGQSTPITPEGMSAFHPAWSPDGTEVAFVSWSNEGGHVWRVRANGRSRPRQISNAPGFYTDTAWSPDGVRILSLRASSYDRLYREFDFGPALGSDLVWFPARGGDAALIVPARGYSRPHFGPEEDRIYLYLSSGYSNSANKGLISVRYDGSDRRTHLIVKGPGTFNTGEEARAEDIRMSPDGRHALILHANQLYVAALLNVHLQNVKINLDTPEVPLARVTDVGADFFEWSRSGTEIFWSVGHQIYSRPLTSVRFGESDEAVSSAATQDAVAQAAVAGTEQSAGAESDPADKPVVAEAHAAVRSQAIEIYRARHVPDSTIALVGATIIPMVTDVDRIEGGIVLIENDRIEAVGTRETVVVPPGAHVVDVTGQFVIPGFVDTHAHYQPLRRVLDTQNWAFLANLAYGVTTGLDVQPSTTDILAYQDLIDAGLMIGPRALSTGPGVFSNNDFRSADHAKAVLTRYKDHYGVNNLKAYLAGNRQQRQWIVAAARQLELMPTTEGALDMKLDLTHVIDGFSGNEHNFPLLDLYEDTVQLIARSQIGYTPALLVNYGGPAAENFFYTRESPYHDAKLRRFMPDNVIARRTLRRPWFADEEFVFPQLAAQAAKIVHAGGRVGVGGHGQLQGLGYHWEMAALASGGLTPREVLRAATRHGAEMIGVGQDIGTVSAGKLADLVVLSDDPTLDIRNSTKIVFVIKNGELFAGDTLDKLWPEAQALPQQWWWKTAPGEVR